MARLNLICNGMMFFNEVGNQLEIVIPDIQGHVRKFCADPQPAKDRLVDVSVGEYQLNVPGGNTARLADLLDSSGYVTLDGNKVTFKRDVAKNISAIFTVPKPSVIRLFRASEPLAGFDMLGNCKSTVVHTPTVAHDIVVLSYKDIPEGTAVSIGPSRRTPLATATLLPFSFVNWILYSNEISPFALPMELSPALDEALNKALAPMRHATPLNTFLEVKAVSGMTPSATTLTLSGIGKKDAPASTAIGISALQQFLFHELPLTHGGAVVTPASGEPGCTGAALATQ